MMMHVREHIPLWCLSHIISEQEFPLHPPWDIIADFIFPIADDQGVELMGFVGMSYTLALMIPGLMDKADTWAKWHQKYHALNGERGHRYMVNPPYLNSCWPWVRQTGLKWLLFSCLLWNMTPICELYVLWLIYEFGWRSHFQSQKILEPALNWYVLSKVMARGAITWSSTPPSGSIHQLNYRYLFKKITKLDPLILICMKHKNWYLELYSLLIPLIF